MSEQTLASSCSYIDSSASQANDYAKEDNYLRDYLTNKFYQDAFSSTDISKIVGRDLTESDLYPRKSSGSTTVKLPDQKVFAPTYDDMNNADEYGFTTNDTRLKSPTDFAIANYTSLYTATDYETIDRVNGGTGMYFLCSSGSSASCAYNVLSDGYLDVFNDVNRTDAGVCPALLFNL